MDLIDTVSSWLAWLVSHVDYLTIFLMMTLEASFIPFPSEAAMIPAGYLSAEGVLNPLFAFASGLCGVAVGSTINYLIGRYIGRTFILRYGRYFLISQESYERSEALFARNAVLFTFVGRLIPAVRQLISIPAGMARMPFGLFMAVTLAGAGIWCAILMGLGYVFGRNEAVIMQYLKDFSLGIVGIIVIMLLIWIIRTLRHRP
ncbi:MAG TPA: DedA family protein [bacterium]|nr:DedA family protein [bacterium]